jgi:hypothetical protein
VHEKVPAWRTDWSIAMGLPADRREWGCVAIERESIRHVRFRPASPGRWVWSEWKSAAIEFAWLDKWANYRLELFGLLLKLPSTIAEGERWWVLPKGAIARPGDDALLIYLQRAMCMVDGDYQNPLVYAEYRWFPSIGRHQSAIRNAERASDDDLRRGRDGFTLLELFESHRETRGRKRRIDDPNHPWRDLVRQYREIKKRECYLTNAQIAYRLNIAESTLEKYLADDRRLRKT